MARQERHRARQTVAMDVYREDQVVPRLLSARTQSWTCGQDSRSRPVVVEMARTLRKTTCSVAPSSDDVRGIAPSWRTSRRPSAGGADQTTAGNDLRVDTRRFWPWTKAQACGDTTFFRSVSSACGGAYFFGRNAGAGTTPAWRIPDVVIVDFRVRLPGYASVGTGSASEMGREEHGRCTDR